MPHSCRAFEDRLDTWFELGTAERESMAREAEDCSPCRDHLEAQQRLQSLFDEGRGELEALSAEHLDPPRFAGEGAAVDELPVAARSATRHLAWALPLAAAVLVTFALIVGDRLRPTPATDGSANPIAESRSIPREPLDAVEEALLRSGAVERPTVTGPPTDLRSARPPTLPSVSAVGRAVRSASGGSSLARRPQRPSGLAFRVPSPPSRPDAGER